ncbi:cyclase family protein [Clostridium sp.]|uniref:cyclase family protein n=1 Tax=Clostridium sp. TaxID=1506 RepID=UPI0026DC0984|nr:cyclase family protein [Clostridium sp.]MDO5040004.1 cyclase family protein [Clostridium sp.]
MQIYDLTHYLEDNMTSYSEEEGYFKKESSTIDKEGYNVLKISLSSHTGTHMDFPRHVFSDGKFLDYFNVEDLIGRAYMINCKERNIIDLKFILKYKEEIEECEYLILNTGYEKYWNDKKYFLNYPRLSYEASRFLSNIRTLKGIGIDCISIDCEDDEKLINHKNLLKNNKLIIENLCGLDKINSNFKIIIAPLKIKSGDGAPCRVYGINN